MTQGHDRIDTLVVQSCSDDLNIYLNDDVGKKKDARVRTHGQARVQHMCVTQGNE